MKSTTKIILIIMLIIILAMVIGYSALATQLTINGTAKINGIWDVRIINIEVQSCSNNCDPGKPEYTNTTATFNARLVKPGDSIVYVVTIKNEGTLNARLENIIFMEYTGSPAIIYETTPLDTTLNSGEQTSFLIKIRYDKNYTEVPEIKTKSIVGIIEYVQE